ncbi:MAG: cytosine permease [[Lactobacillus] timonensis]|jgi:cytosine permease|uniref:cytosine permease n=1 Tax=[Lactobacillus] timonensis TaxID=1970790 RepID=UPI00235391F5|nr:cytosine permease [[Lactobacillus] timonensis]MCI1926570.1 cytosine permease [[Lactobacillus] timonensis]MCI1957970.1 cytosine permease [[Lactobacillus] timonensis]MCI1970974.1 cytosine permease [[Lactobacillus] timonensis]MCI2007106.1 cytosine permease [[Lactobacillus] timonensis]
MNNKQNQKWWGLAFVWAGALVSIPSLLLGGTLVSGMTLANTLLTALVGYGLVVVIMIFQGMQSSDLARPTVKVAEHVFGKKGSQRVISTLIAVGCLGWFGIQANVAGAAFNGLLGAFGLHLPLWVADLFWGVIMVGTAIYGIKAVRWLTYVAVPYLVLVCLYGLFHALQTTTWSRLMAYQPAHHLSFATGLTTTLGGFALGAVIAGDYSQYSPHRKDVVKAAVWGVIPAGVLMIAVGAILTIAYHSSDLSALFIKVATPLVGGLALVLATWKVNVINAFSGGIAFNNVFNVPQKYQKPAVFLVGMAGTVLAIFGIMNFFEPVMNLLGAMVPPAAGVMSADYWMVNHGHVDTEVPVADYHWRGIVAWAAGALIAAVPVVMSFFPNLPHWSVNPLTGIVISLVLYLLLVRVGRPVKEAGQEEVEN